MAEENKNIFNGGEQTEVKDRGLFDFMGKKNEKKQQPEVVPIDVDNEEVDETKAAENKKESLFDKLHRSRSSGSSSSSDEEEDANEEKKKKRRGLKEKINGDHKKDAREEEKIATVVVAAAPAVGETREEMAIVDVDKVDEAVKVEVVTAPEEGKKGFLEKIKEKLPGHKKESANYDQESGTGGNYNNNGSEGTGEEKKGILGKIMDKLPGYHKEEIDKNTPPVGH